MRKRFYEAGFLLLTIIGLLPFLSFQKATLITLKDEPVDYKPAGFFIADVTDERTNKTPFAKLVTATANNKASTILAELEGGVRASINKFTAHNLPKDQSQRPVIISIKEFKLTESALADNRADGIIKVKLSFGLQKDYGFMPLIDYQGGLHYNRAITNTNTIEPNLRKALLNGLAFFNNWMKANTLTNIKLAQNVKISFIDYSDPIEGDTIYYSAKRPLKWDDFKSKVRPTGPYAAAVSPSIGYDQHTNVVNGVIEVTIYMKALLPKTTCWVLPNAKTDYNLNHEQRHFDIVKIIAEQYKHKVLTAQLTPDTYEAFIGMQYLDSYRDMHTLQTAYDKETRNGGNNYAQLNWESKIDMLLKSPNADGLLKSL